MSLELGILVTSVVAIGIWFFFSKDKNQRD
jgi:hypothetical protein